MSTKRRTFSAKEKSKIAIAALQERQTASELCSEYGIHPSQLSTWKKQAKEGIEQSFVKQPKLSKELAVKEDLIERLYREVGRLEMELKWLKKKV